ncbi:hypothetical protein HOA92_01290 [archaeon]|jgi:hypothetical protein|nr:hypothetical protein [archaeon]MBT6761652.1 hypothetical protein [archaeon]
MEEHKLLTGMLLVALVVSIVGTVITVDRLGALGGGTDSSFTGAITGSANLTITVDTTISLPSSEVTLGSGNVAANASFATIDTSLPLSVDDGTWANQSYNITVRNDGNVKVNVTIQSNVTRGNGTGIVPDSWSFACSGTTENTCGLGFNNESGEELEFAYKGADNEGNSCNPNHLSTEYQSFNNSLVEYPLCGCLDYASQVDEVLTYLKIGIPGDTTGLKEATITFTAVQPGPTCPS